MTRILLGGSLLLLIFWLLCLPRQLFDDPLATIVLDRDGALMNATIATDGQWRIPPADSISPKLISAIIAFEDRRFYTHPGVDLRALARAFRQNIRAGRVVSGGSTISMQVIRLASKNPPRTVYQKILEILRATRLESRYSKHEILRFWCANAPFGGNVVGVEAAAWRYYGRSANDLSWAEAATLAVLPNSPGLIYPGRSRTALLNKRDRLLIALAETGQLSAEDLELSRLETLPDKPKPLARNAPHLLNRLKKEFGAGRYQTTLNGDLQRRINSIVDRHQRKLVNNEIHNAAALVLEVATGKVLAYVGNAPGAGPQQGVDVDMITAARSPGSLLKPVLYGMSISNGTITPTQLLPDYPSNFNGFRPANFNDGFSGAVPADQALSRSLNIPFVYLLRQFGIPNFLTGLREFGFSHLHQPAGHYGLSLVLGGCEISLEEIAGFFLGLSRQQRYYYARQGQYAVAQDWNPPVLFPESDLAQTFLAPTAQLSHQAGGIDAGAGYLLLQALTRLERPNAQGEWERMGSGRKISWKTGTSFGFRDAWAVGTTPEYVVAVWTGNADGSGRNGLVGVRTAAPLMFDIFRELPSDNTPWFEAPYDDLRQLDLCPQSGQLAGPFCAGTATYVPVHAERAEVCGYHHRIHLDSDDPERARRVNLNCALDASPVNWFVLPTRMAHFYRREHPEYRSLPPWRTDCQQTSDDTESPAMALIYPYSNGAITLGKDATGAPLPAVFRLAHRYPATAVHWHLDEHYLTTTSQFHNCELRPSPGHHQLTLIDAEGRRLVHHFQVK